MLLYTKELVAPRAKLRQGLQRFKAQPERQKYKLLFSSTFDHSTIHGVHNAFVEQYLWVRLFWLLVVLLATVGFLIMFAMLDHHHNEQLLVSVVETTQLPIYSVDFPAIAICPWNHVNWMRAPTAAQRFLPKDATPELHEVFRQLLISMEHQLFGRFDGLGDLIKYNLTGLEQLSLSKLTNYMAYRCDELFMPGSCVFDETSYDCCQLFLYEQTEWGTCMVFNSLISEDSRKKQLINQFYPHKLSTAGEDSGLEFTLRLNQSFMRPGNRLNFSVGLMIKQPKQWTISTVYALYENTETFIAVDPLVMEVTPNTHELHPSQRRCYLEHEHQLYFPAKALLYSRQNCIATCRQWNVLQHCKCIMPQYLPVIDGARECSVLDLDCIYRNAGIFSLVKMEGQDKYINDSLRGMECKCINSCNTQQYYILMNVREIKHVNGINVTKLQKRIKTRIYFGQRVMTKIQTKRKYTYHDWMASFGGILGLYIGASALSFGELASVLIKLLWMLLRQGYAKIKPN
ncbi:ppk19 [Drosophila busckii]|uniref:Ppk19 n=1 Tax=Drosophila busckii TaxID=30019 RepID=A0A0M3QXM6_DROBS|nr:ppk19 [Drosophila busckii]